MDYCMQCQGEKMCKMQQFAAVYSLPALWDGKNDLINIADLMYKMKYKYNRFSH